MRRNELRTLIKEIVSSVLAEMDLRGEYWIQDGSAWFADGDVGDMNHEAVVISAVIGNVLSDLGVDANEEYASLEEHYEEIFENIKDELLPNEIEEWSYSKGDKNDIIVNYLSRKGDTTIKKKMSVIEGSTDARDYGMEVYGWKRVKQNNVQTETLTPDDLKSISYGLNDILSQEGNGSDDENDEELTFNIEVNSTRSWYTDVPLSVIEKHDPVLLNPYRGRFEQ